MFEGHPSYSRYRTLALVSPIFVGEDVYALQTALLEMKLLPSRDACDGKLGPKTSDAIRMAQRMLSTSASPLIIDGAAGAVTQAAITRAIAEQHRSKYNLPEGLPYSQCMHESSCRVGNYSPMHGNTYDAGVAQRNTQFTPPPRGFDVPDSIDALGENLRKFYDKFVGVKNTRRRWALACGSWNAPAFACWLANEEGASVSRRECAKPGEESRRLLENYMSSAIALMP